jgi:hypothetical protein
MSKLGLLNNTIVHYHVKRYTKNNRMNQILMRGLFLTCTESSFLFLHTHNRIENGCVFA